MAEPAKLTERVVEFLSTGTRTGMLGYLAADGRPLVAPVWFVVDGEQLAFSTGRDTSKGHALHRDPRVVMCVDDPHPPCSFVQVQGMAAVSEDPADLLDPYLSKPPGPAPATWAPTAPRSSAAATAFPANWWCGCARPRSLPVSISATDFSNSATSKETR